MITHCLLESCSPGAAPDSETYLAAKAEVTASAVAQWEHPARTRPALHHLLRIAEVTGVGLEWLLTGKGRRNQYRLAPPSERPAVSLDTYAQDAYEETLLSRFRTLSARRKDLLLALLEELSISRSSTTRK